MNIPKIIHQIWLGGRVPPDIMDMMMGVWAKHTDWHHIIWTDELLPHLGVEADTLKAKLGSWAAVSNMVRLLVLKKYGGIYIDADMVCLKPLHGLLGSGAIAALQDTTRVCNALMGAPENHDWISWQLAHWHDFDQRDAASGVYLASEAPRADLTLIPTHLVYPYPWDAQPEKRVAHPESLLEHKWVGTWKT